MPLPPLLIRKASFPLIANLKQDILYSLGGLGGSDELSFKELQSVERFERRKNKWYKATPLNEARSSGGGCVFLSNFIFFFGGKKKHLLL